MVNEVLSDFSNLYKKYWHTMMCKKIGLFDYFENGEMGIHKNIKLVKNENSAHCERHCWAAEN